MLPYCTTNGRLSSQVAQLQKQKAKKASKKASSGEPSKDESTSAETPTKERRDDQTIATEEQPEHPEQPEPPKAEAPQPEQAAEPATEPMPDAPTSPGPEPLPDEGKDLPTRTHGRKPSVSAQSRMRSSSFRSSMSGLPSGISPKSPPLTPLVPDSEQIHEVFRKQAARVEELEKENKRLEKELEEANARRQRLEEQLEDLREANTEVVELKDRLERAEKQVAEMEQLVSRRRQREKESMPNCGMFRKQKLRLFNGRTLSSNPNHSARRPVLRMCLPRTLSNNWSPSQKPLRRWKSRSRICAPSCKLKRIEIRVLLCVQRVWRTS